MSKRFNTLDTLRILLAHPKIMYQCIESMNRHKENYIKETTLAVIIRDYLKPLDTLEQQRLRIAFDIDNLRDANVIADIDKRDGNKILLFQEAVLMVFRLCEASLYQEITDAKLRSRLVSLRDARTRLESASFVMSDPDYRELTEDIVEQLGHLLGMLRTNIIAMQQIGMKFETMSAEASKSPENFTTYRQTLFEKIAHLFERHIKPTLSFLDQNSRLHDGSNLFETLTEMERSYKANNKPDIAHQIFRFSMSFTNTFQPIANIARQVDHFLRKTRLGMLQYNAMEHHCQKLLKLHQQTQSSNLTITYMDRREFSRNNDFVCGLKQQRRPQTYQFGKSVSYFENFFAEISLRLSIDQMDQPLLVKVGESHLDQQVASRIQRVERLYAWLSTQAFRPTKDIVAVLHYRLCDELEGYHFPDLLMAITRLNHKIDWDYEVMTSNQFLRISLQDDAFIYRKRQLTLKKGTVNVC